MPLVLLPASGDLLPTSSINSHSKSPLTITFIREVTLRGFGSSSSLRLPKLQTTLQNRLGDDVIAAHRFNALRLDRPISRLGHSIAGEELSSVGTRYTEKVFALIYIDAGYSYALYDKADGDPVLDTPSSCGTKLEANSASRHASKQPQNSLMGSTTETRQLEQSLQQRKEDLSDISPASSR